MVVKHNDHEWWLGVDRDGDFMWTTKRHRAYEFHDCQSADIWAGEYGGHVVRFV